MVTAKKGKGWHTVDWRARAALPRESAAVLLGREGYVVEFCLDDNPVDTAGPFSHLEDAVDVARRHSRVVRVYGGRQR